MNLIIFYVVGYLKKTFENKMIDRVSKSVKIVCLVWFVSFSFQWWCSFVAVAEKKRFNKKQTNKGVNRWKNQIKEEKQLLVQLVYFVYCVLCECECVTKGSYSLACGKVMPVNEGDKVSVYISHPVPCR